jgi:hypothetical protein
MFNFSVRASSLAHFGSHELSPIASLKQQSHFWPSVLGDSVFMLQLCGTQRPAYWQHHTTAWSIVRLPVPRCNAVRILPSRLSSFCNTTDSDLLGVVCEHCHWCLIQLRSVSCRIGVGRVLAVSTQLNIFVLGFPSCDQAEAPRTYFCHLVSTLPDITVLHIY